MKQQQKHNTHLNPREAADYIGMSTDWLALQRKHCYGPAYSKYGNARNSPVRYSLEDLDAYVSSTKVKVA